jgi:hypothetical protein
VLPKAKGKNKIKAKRKEQNIVLKYLKTPLGKVHFLLILADFHP